MITFNQINSNRHTCQYARLVSDSAYKDEIYSRYRTKEGRYYVRQCPPETYLNNIMWSKAGEAMEPKIAHIPGDTWADGRRHHYIPIPYFAHIPNPNGTPGHITIWLHIDPSDGIYLSMERPNGGYTQKRLTGNKPATMENIQKEAEKLHSQHYLPESHPAAVLHRLYGATKSEAVKAWITMNKTGYYKCGRFNGKFWCESCEAPPVSTERAILRRLRRKNNIKAVDIWDERKLLKLLKYPRRAKLTTAKDAPNFWDLCEQYSYEHDTDEPEEMEQFLNQYFEPETIYI